MKAALKIALGSIVLTLLLVWGAWLVAVPVGALRGRLVAEALRTGFELDLVGFKKGLFFSVSASAVDLRRLGVRVFTIENPRARLAIAPLLGLRLEAPIEGEIAGGTLRGTLALSRGAHSIEIKVRDAGIERTGLYDLTGLKVRGRLSVDLALSGGQGEGRILIEGVEAEALALESAILPLNMVRTVRGAFRIEGPAVVLRSLAGEGPGLYARVSGVLKDGVFKGKCEFLPEESAFPDSVLSIALEQYRLERGRYEIPISYRLK